MTTSRFHLFKYSLLAVATMACCYVLIRAISDPWCVVRTQSVSYRQGAEVRIVFTASRSSMSAYEDQDVAEAVWSLVEENYWPTLRTRIDDERRAKQASGEMTHYARVKCERKTDGSYLITVPVYSQFPSPEKISGGVAERVVPVDGKTRTIKFVLPEITAAN